MVSYIFIKRFQVQNHAMGAIFLGSSKYWGDKFPQLMCTSLNNSFFEELTISESTDSVCLIALFVSKALTSLAMYQIQFFGQ